MENILVSRQKLKMETRISKVDAGYQRRWQDCKVWLGFFVCFFFFELEYTAYNYFNSVQNLPFDDC